MVDELLKCSKCEGDYYSEDLKSGQCLECRTVRLVVCSNAETLTDSAEVPSVLKDELAQAMTTAACNALQDNYPDCEVDVDSSFAKWHGEGACGNIWTKDKPSDELSDAIDKAQEAMDAVVKDFETEFRADYIEEFGE